MTRVRLPASSRTVCCVVCEALPAIESYTNTHFLTPCTVSQCLRTGENNTWKHVYLITYILILQSNGSQLMFIYVCYECIICMLASHSEMAVSPE